MARFNRGDIIHVELDPSVGKEMKGNHYALVVSPNEFHPLGLHIICPISNGNAEVARNSGYLVSLMNTGLDFSGNIHVHQVQSVDLRERNAVKKGTAPDDLVAEVLDKLNGLFL